jgi:RNA polymerase sigma-70 factor (ECF subfamily)
MNENAMPLYDDEYCLLRIREGEERFFTLIFEKYRDQLFAYLYRVTKSKEVAEEIVLDVFLKLWHGREAITEIQNFEAFLHKVAHNKAIDFFRAAKRSPELQQALWESITEVQAADKADNRILIKNIDALIKEAVNRLSPQRRRVFELRNYEELSYAEIADTLELSSNTVRNHLAASLQFIRDYLQRNSAFLLILVWHF